MILSENWPDAITVDIRTYFRDEFVGAEKMIPILFNVQNSEKPTESVTGAGEYPDWEEFTGTVGYNDAYELYKRTFTHTEYVAGLKVERKLLDDDMHNVIKSRAEGMARAGVRTREKHGASVFNDAFTAEDTAQGDGTELCASDHPRPKDSTTQSNEGTSGLTEVNLDATRILMKAFKDDQGDFCGVDPDLIIIPRNLQKTAWELVNSMGQVNTANNNKNFYYGMFKLAVCDRLSDSNNWFLADSKLMKRHLLWFNRIPVEFRKDTDSDTLIGKWVGYMRYSYGYDCYWQWLFGQLVA